MLAYRTAVNLRRNVYRAVSTDDHHRPLPPIRAFGFDDLDRRPGRWLDPSIWSSATQFTPDRRGARIPIGSRSLVGTRNSGCRSPASSSNPRTTSGGALRRQRNVRACRWRLSGVSFNKRHASLGRVHLLSRPANQSQIDGPIGRESRHRRDQSQISAPAKCLVALQNPLMI